MKTVIKIAWRNIWRNKLRSLTVIVSMVLGLFSGLFAVSMMLGLNDQRMGSAVDSYLSHIQIHHPSFNENFDIKHTVENFDSLKISLKNDQTIKAFSSRTIISGMASTAHGSAGIRLIGIDPTSESKVTNVHTSMVKGTYFNSIKSKPALIGKKLAEKLQLDIKKKIYLTFVDENGDQQRIKLKVEGIFKTASTLFDRTNIYMKREDLQKILANNSAIHEIGIICEDLNIVDSKVDALNKSFPNNKIESWGQIAPELGYAQEIMGSVVYIFMGIILIALSFGIINTMLMAVLERTRELGMLMAVGMNRSKVFLMIILETILLGVIAAPIGLVLGFLTNAYFGSYGIDLSSYSEGMEKFGLSDVVYTHMQTADYLLIMIAVAITAILGALYPAFKAIRLKPVEAIRKI